MNERGGGGGWRKAVDVTVRSDSSSVSAGGRAAESSLHRVAVMMTLNPSTSSCPLKLNKHSGTFSHGGDKLLARFSRVPLKYAEIIFDKSATGF